MVFTNYRPVSVLPIFSKILERLMYNRLIDYINENKLLYKYQFGFQKGKSTYMAVLTLVDKISEALDNGDYVIGVFLDFSKASDTVDHDILLRKLEKYGIRGTALDWFTDYLSNRLQYVTYNGAKPKREIIKCGVPQGSILGPLLFLLYINELSTVSNDCFSVLFADDTNMFVTGKNTSEMCVKLNNDLQEICEWLRCNKLSLNILKTHYMIFTTKNKTAQDLDIKISNTAVERVYDTKFLGVYIDAQLTWKRHIEYTCSKLSKCAGILLKARKKLNKSALILLYYSFAYPYFIYWNQVWGDTYPTNLGRMVLLQKRLVRGVTCSHYRAHTEPLMLANQLLSINDINVYVVGIFMYNYVTQKLPQIFENYL